MKDRFKQLNNRTYNWSKETGILEFGKPMAQQSKTEEEVGELREALIMQNNNISHYTNSKGVVVCTEDEIEDGIGDSFITLLIQCYLQQKNPLDCLEIALKEIEGRTGKMINGTFVKNS